MSHPLIARERLPIIASSVLGVALTALAWGAWGWGLGAPTALLSALLVWRAARMGAVIDTEGVTLRAFLPGRDQRLPWSTLRGVAVDEVRSGTDEGRTTELRLRFLLEGAPPPQVLGCSVAVAEATLARFRERGLSVTDTRGG